MLARQCIFIVPCILSCLPNGILLMESGFIRNRSRLCCYHSAAFSFLPGTSLVCLALVALMLVGWATGEEKICSDEERDTISQSCVTSHIGRMYDICNGECLCRCSLALEQVMYLLNHNLLSNRCEVTYSCFHRPHGGAYSWPVLGTLYWYTALYRSP